MGLLQLAYKNIIQRKSRFILTTLSVVIGVMFVVGVFLLSNGLRATFGNLADDIVGDSDLVVRAEQNFGNRDDNSPSVPASLGQVLESTQGVRDVVPGVADFGVIIQDRQGMNIDAGPAPVIGINWDDSDREGSRRANRSLFLNPAYGDGSGRIPAGMDEFAVDTDTALENNMQLGEEFTITISSGRYSGERSIRLVGVFDFAEEGNNSTLGAVLVAFDSQTASNFFNDGQGFDQYDVFIDTGITLQQVEENITVALAASPEVAADLAESKVNVEIVGTEVVAQEARDTFNSALDSFRNFLLVFAFIILLVSTFVIYNTFSIILDQRIKELGLLRALGINGTQIQKLILGEAVVVGIFSTLIGFGLGIGLFYGMIAILGSFSGGLSSVPIVINLTTILAAILVGVGITVVSAIAPSARSKRIPPIAAIREGSSALLQAETKTNPIQGAIVGGAGIVLAFFAARSSWTLLILLSLLATIALYWGGSRIKKSVGQVSVLALGGLWLLLAAVLDLKAGEAFSLYGVGAIIVFIGVNLVSPIFGAGTARVLGYPFRKIFGIVGHLGVENSARNPKRTAATSSALMIGLALVATSAVLVSSLKATFSDVLENAVKADWIVCRSDCTSADTTDSFSSSVAEDLDDLDESSSAIGYRYIDQGIRVNGVIQADNTVTFKEDVFDVFGTKLTELDQHMDLDVKEIATDVSGDNDVFVYVDRAEAYDLSIGSQVQMEFLSGQVETVRVVAIFEENRVLFSDWILSQSLLDRHNQVQRDLFATVVATPDFSESQERAAYAAVAARTVPGAAILTSEEFNDDQVNQLNTILIVITFFLGLSFVVAILGVANTLSLSIFERIREIGLLRAVGQKRRQVRLMIVLEGLVVAFFGCVFGIGLGILFGSVGVLVIPDSFISVLAFEPLWLVGYGVGGAVAGFISTIIPAIRAGRLNILRAIASE